VNRPAVACLASTIFCTVFATAPARAQGRGGGAWTTTGGDAQRSASVRSDPRISPATVSKNFQLLWQRTLDNPSKLPNPLTQPLLLPNIISYKGFKALVFVGGGGDNVYALDYDLARPFWSRHLPSAAPRAAASPACPGGLSTITRATSSGRTTEGRGRGAQGARGAPPPSAPPTPGSGPGPNAVLGGLSGRGNNLNVYAISSDGKLHALNPQDGTDMVPPIPFLPSGAHAVGAILIDTTVYAATSGNCGGAPNGVWAIELANDAYTVGKWETKASIAGDGPAFGPDGTIYVAAGNELVSLDPKGLTVKARSGELSEPFTSSPVVVKMKNKVLIIAGTKSAVVSAVDEGAKLVATSTPVTSAPGAVAGVAATDDANAPLIVASVTGRPHASIPAGNGAAANGSIVAFKAADENGTTKLQPQWASRDVTSPAPPLVIDGVVFAVGARTQKGAVLFALDAATGKELWTSGSAIGAPVRGIGPSGGDGQVYVATADGTLYAFGIPVER
jgi:outer membrane protein assembly factor BamB